MPAQSSVQYRSRPEWARTRLPLFSPEKLIATCLQEKKVPMPLPFFHFLLEGGRNEKFLPIYSGSLVGYVRGKPPGTCILATDPRNGWKRILDGLPKAVVVGGKEADARRAEGLVYVIHPAKSTKPGYVLVQRDGTPLWQYHAKIEEEKCRTVFTVEGSAVVAHPLVEGWGIPHPKSGMPHVACKPNAKGSLHVFADEEAYVGLPALGFNFNGIGRASIDATYFAQFWELHLAALLLTGEKTH